jgi:hypothetical protein
MSSLAIRSVESKRACSLSHIFKPACPITALLGIFVSSHSIVIGHGLHCCCSRIEVLCRFAHYPAMRPRVVARYMPSMWKKIRLRMFTSFKSLCLAHTGRSVHDLHRNGFGEPRIGSSGADSRCYEVSAAFAAIIAWPTRRDHPKPTSWRQAGLPRCLRWACLHP